MKKVSRTGTRIIKIISGTENFKKAFTHTSFQNERSLGQGKSYECLEFLGDSILNFHVSFFIYRNYPGFSEGQMSKLKQFMIKESSLEEVSKSLGLSKFLMLGEAEKRNGGLKKTSILADIFESLIGAIYLEKGELLVKEFLNETLFEWISGKEYVIWDYKTKLQEFCQSEKNSLTYTLIGTSDVNCEREFTVEVRDSFKKLVERGKGKTKKSAEQEAAFKAMKALGLI